MFESNGVVNEIPEAIEVPPVNVVYQFITPAEAVAPRVSVPDPQLEAGEVDIMVGIVLIVASILVLMPVVQPFSIAST